MDEKWLTLVPAYGRDYKTADEVLKHWTEGKDFRIADVSSRWNGSYTSERDHLPGQPHAAQVLKIRYNKLADFVLVRRIDATWVQSPDPDEDDDWMKAAEQHKREFDTADPEDEEGGI